MGNKPQTMVKPDAPTYLEALHKVSTLNVDLIKSLDLGPTRANQIGRTLMAATKLQNEGLLWKLYGDRLYAIQIVAATLVPVLIGVLGSFNDRHSDFVIRLIAICLSILGTISKAIEDVYNLRQRGQIRVGYGDSIFVAYDEFVGLCGKLYDPDFKPENQDGGGQGAAYDNAIVIPDLSGVPVEILERQLELMKSATASAGPTVTFGDTATVEGGKRIDPHGLSYKRFMAKCQILSGQARAAAFVGQTAAGAGT